MSFAFPSRFVGAGVRSREGSVCTGGVIPGEFKISKIPSPDVLTTPADQMVKPTSDLEEWSNHLLQCL